MVFYLPKKNKLNCRRLNRNESLKLFTIETLIKNDADAPDVDFGGDFGWRFADNEAFRRQVPVGSGALRRQIHAVLRIVIVLVHDFREAEIRDFDITANATVAQQDVARLQIVVNDWRFDLVQVFQSRNNLRNDRP